MLATGALCTMVRWFWRRRGKEAMRVEWCDQVAEGVGSSAVKGVESASSG